MQRGFSLVELSIVLVILGLLTGGILAGQSLIRASELRAIATEYQRWMAATNSFRDKYFAIPGDLSSATRFWTRQVNVASCITNSSAAVGTPGVCDGNGDGILNSGTGASLTGETFQFWRQLASAGLVEGNYSGLAGSGSIYDHTIDTNCPRSKLGSAGWGLQYQGVWVGDTISYAADYGNLLGFGGSLAASIPMNGILKPEEAWNIDSKLDDGRPGAGKIIMRSNNAWNATATSTACSLSANNTDYTAGYNLANSSAVCSLYFVRAF